MLLLEYNLHWSGTRTEIKVRHTKWFSCLHSQLPEHPIDYQLVGGEREITSQSRDTRGIQQQDTIHRNSSSSPLTTNLTTPVTSTATAQTVDVRGQTLDTVNTASGGAPQLRRYRLPTAQSHCPIWSLSLLHSLPFLHNKGPDDVIDHGLPFKNYWRIRGHFNALLTHFLWEQDQFGLGMGVRVTGRSIWF